jgi:hypothetical protein
MLADIKQLKVCVPSFLRRNCMGSARKPNPLLNHVHHVSHAFERGGKYGGVVMAERNVDHFVVPVPDMAEPCNQVAKHNMEHAEDEYYQWLSKSLSRPCGGEGDAHMDVDRETMKKKSKFDLLRLEYLGLLTDLNSRRRFELLAFFGKFIQVICLIDSCPWWR